MILVQLAFRELTIIWLVRKNRLEKDEVVVLLYPLLFTPILKERIWGGQKIEEKFGRKIERDRIAESWDIACHENGMSIVANGKHTGKSLQDLIHIYGRKLMGNSLCQKNIDKFPLLIKILDAADVLSVQVHPEDEYAALHENGELGKTEMWYIIDAEPGAYLYYGIQPGTERLDFQKAIHEGDVEKYLCLMNVNPGDVLYIPAGMVHAIGPGILLCEIQQNSDTTYRVFDWNRKGDDGAPRKLHIEKALDVIDFEGKHCSEKLRGLQLKEKGYTRTYYVACPYFAMEKLDIWESVDEFADGDKFYILTAVEGQGKILYGEQTQTFREGDSIMIPATLGSYSIQGNCTIIKSYVPDQENDIIAPLKGKGFTKAEIKSIAGI